MKKILIPSIVLYTVSGIFEGLGVGVFFFVFLQLSLQQNWKLKHIVPLLCQKCMYIGDSDLHLGHLGDLTGFFFTQCKVNITTSLSFSLVLVMRTNKHKAPAIVKIHFAKCGVRLFAVMSWEKDFNYFSIVVIVSCETGRPTEEFVSRFLQAGEEF